MSQDQSLVIGIVVGEASGDLLGAGLMRALRQRFPYAQFRGIGGPKMLAEGFESLFPQDRLAVMGLVEPLARLPELLRIRRALRQHFLQCRPSVFIGIDSPDFNLDLAVAACSSEFCCNCKCKSSKLATSFLVVVGLLR